MFIPYQKCPMCEGEGKSLSANYNPENYTATYEWKLCDVCNGKKIIPMHYIDIDMEAGFDDFISEDEL